MTPTRADVLAAVAAETGFTIGRLLGNQNYRGLPAARRAAMHLMHTRCGLTRGEIGRALRYAGSSSVDVGLAKARDALLDTPKFRDLVARAAARLPGGSAAPREDPRKLPRIRKCLMCRKRFESGHAGERVCRPCKATAVWAGGGDCRVWPG